MSTSYRLPKGSRVLVTGATGLVGSATTEELVKRGYIVRAATRDASKTRLFADKLNKLYGDGLFEAVEIKDFAAPGAYKKALEGVVGVVHIASDVSFTSGDVDKVVGQAIDATVGLLEAAAQIPEVKALVLTSSRAAVYSPEYGKDAEWSLTDFADYLYDVALQVADGDPSKPFLAYAASKVKVERAAWDFIKNHNPRYSFNVVIPDMVMGPVANPAEGFYSTASWANQLFNGDTAGPTVGASNPPAHIVDVRDAALIHVAALLAEDVDRERLWALAHPYHINDFLKIWREAYPEHKDTIPADLDFPAAPKQIVDNSRSAELLQRFAGRSWIDFRTTVIDNVKGSPGDSGK